MRLFAPATEAEAAGIVRAHPRIGLAIAGGGTRMVNHRNPALSARSLCGVRRYRPQDMTMTAAAGTPLSAIEEVLASHGQRLGFEPTSAIAGRSTIGAVAAMNLSGPRRPFAGSARDALLGLRMVTGLGERVSTGGRVIKNAAGLDLTRAIAGSFGSLAFITEVTFRTMPVPAAGINVVLPGMRASMLPAVAARLMLKGLPLTGAAHLDGVGLGGVAGAGPVALLRFEGSASAVAAAKRHLDSLDLAVAVHDGGDPWGIVARATVLAPGAGQALWRVTIPETAGGALAEQLAREGADVLTDRRGGLLRLRHGVDFARRLAALVAPMPGASASLEAGPPRAAILPDHNQPGAAMLARLKQALDPNAVFVAANRPGAAAA
ncbi:MAG: FAD-binding protein [Bauldia sp.]|uniref:FAD-binding protein n=1 Tax=Bauldia sp. TaxID=2575872 RepID=UPI001DA70C2F|nr:FAD-binding protein [Bauldia sp.]MCB1494345.1 FAD-binding protein [Bauldia sp.]